MSRVLVTGGCGAIGSRLTRALGAAGHRVRIIDRVPPVTSSPGAEVVQADLADRAALTRAANGIGVIFHLAALVHVTDPTPEQQTGYERVNVEGTRNLVEAAHAAGVERVVFFSTINVYGPSRAGCIHDEESPLHPDSRYAESKAVAERVVLDAVPGVVLRLAAAYGPGMKGNYLRLLRALRRRRFILVGGGRNRRTVVYVDDVCVAALLAATHPAATGRIFNVTDGRIHTVSEIVAAISRALGRRPPRLRVPVAPVRLGAGLVEVGARTLGFRPPITRGMIDKYTEDVAVDGSRFQRELGFRPAYDLETGWRETVAEMRLAGRL